MSKEPINEGSQSLPDKMVIKTGSAKYSFSSAWTENEDLNNILVGLVADDLKKQGTSFF